jgi:outer membrane protein assembly factor BamB
MKTPLILFALIVVCFGFSAEGENWPRFRGPTGQGISRETGLLTDWSAASNVLWKTEVPGQGWSSPIVWENQVFVTSATDNGTVCRVICLDRISGKIVWNTKVFEQVPLRKEGKNSYATSTPCTDGERVYAVFGDGSIAALAFDGSIVWTNREFPYYSRHGLGTSPILHGGLLILQYDWSSRVNAPGNYPAVTTEERMGWQIPWDKSFIAALDVKTGQRAWTGQRGMSRIGHATPLIFSEEGKERLLSITGDVVQSFDPKTGERIWSVYCQGEGLTPSPVVGDGLIFAASGFEKTTLRGIRPGGRGDATGTNIVWEQRKGVPTLSSPLYVKPYLYAITDGGIASCFNSENGEIVWQERIGGSHSASPIHADGKIYFLSENGEATVIAPGPVFKILARSSIDEKCQASAAVSQKCFFIRSEKNLFCIGRWQEQAADGALTLLGKDANIHGTTVRYEPQPHKNTIGYWTRAQDWVSWDFKLNQPGTFQLDLTQACGNRSGGSKYQVTIGSETLTDTMPETGAFTNFVTRTIGKVSLAQPGSYTLSVKPITKPGQAVMDLRAVMLKPVR